MPRILRSAIATVASLVVAGAVTTAIGAPADLFNGSGPRADAPGPDGEKLDAGDWGVAHETGAATYTVPIAVPPGRRGMAPSLALRYSSQGALRGGLAAGWSMELPSIQVDRSSLLAGPAVYLASLGGKSGRLIPVSETPAVAGATTYRLDFDDSFIRFERLTCSSGCRKGWLARTSDGTRYYFDDATSFFGGGRRWSLSEQVDAFGNSVVYSWVDASVDGRTRSRRLSTIDYGRNTAVGLAHHARVVFDYALADTCFGMATPIGAALEYDDQMAGTTSEWGRYYEWPNRLTTIRTQVIDAPGGAMRDVRTYTLSYDAAAMSCSQDAAPLRYLTRVDITGKSADGLTTAAPAMTFAYGRQLRQLSHPTTLAAGVYPERGNFDGASAAYVDYDGDGLLDLTSVGVSAAGKCELRWSKGTRGGASITFVAQPARPLPTAKWAGSMPAGIELCNWNGQLTKGVNQMLTTTQQCPTLGTRFGYRWMDWNRDGRLDLWTTAWIGGGYEPSADPGVLGLSPVVDNDDELGCDNQEDRHPEVVTSGFGVRIYFQQNDGSIHPRPYMLELPTPLPPPGNDGLLRTSSLPGNSLPQLLDLNGDGNVDLLNVAALPLGTPGAVWTVRLGDGSTGFGGSKTWSTPLFGSYRGSTGSSTEGDYLNFRSHSGVALRDVNGDGLVDLVVESRSYTYAGIGLVPDGAMVAFINTGRGFGNEPVRLYANGSIDTVQINGSDPVWNGSGQQVRDGYNGQRRRLADVDGDGLLDQLILPATDASITAAGSALVSYGMGGGFLPARARTLNNAMKRLYRADDYVWRVEGDYADGDGDGVDDLITWNGSTGSALGENTALGPMRLLTSAANGRGAVVRFTYALSTDGQTVTGSTAGMGAPRWLVKAVALEPGTGAGGAQPAVTTSYGYASPFVGTPSNRGERSRFLGFRTVTTTSSSGRKVVTSYQYGVTYNTLRDGSARPSTVEEWSAGTGGVYTLDSTRSITYATLGLFLGDVAFAYPQTTVARTCGPGVTEATANTCRNQTTDLLRVTQTWETRGHPCSGTFCVVYPYVGVKTMTEESASLTSAAGDRRTVATYEHRIGQTPYTTLDYRLLPTSSELQEAFTLFGGGLVWVMASKQITAYSTSGLPITETTLVDGSQAAVTTRIFDSVGNLWTTKKPAQQGTSAVSVLGYDGAMRFVTTRTNELGHVSTSTYDAGTGLERRVNGPRGSGSVRENQEWTRDGLGRVTERRVGTGASFTPTAVERITYNDAVVPNRITTTRLVSFGGAAWTSASRDVDGAGRVVRTIEASAQGNAVTTYTYDAAGKVVAVDSPDPRVDTGATVRSTYTFDPQGRLKSFRGPDATGVDMIYDRRSRRATEVVGSNGVAASKTTRADAFGRLVEVREHQPGAADAVTTYAHDAAGRMRTVTDADGNATYFSHDLAGRRTEIQRGARRWRYGYDRNGNLVSAIAPVPAGSTDAAYTTTSTYDALDRITARTPARRGRTDATLNAMAAGPATFAYDAGALEIGRLSQETVKRWETTANPFVAISYDYDALGQVSGQQWTVRPDGGTSAITGSVTRTYNAQGGLAESVWDGADRWQLTYDGRALPLTVDYKASTGSYQTLASFQRALDGGLRAQTSPGGQTRSFVYDLRGRVTSDIVRATISGATVERARLAYQYYGDGSMAQMSGTVGGMAAFGDYDYDELGRLIFAAGPTGNHWSYDYSRAGNITHLDGQETGVTRDLNWTYGVRDPQAVDAVTPMGGGAAYAAYTYDPSGNVTRRTMATDQLDLTWDGEDRLRTAVSSTGNERYVYDARGNRIASVGLAGTRVWMAEAEFFLPLAGTGFRKYLHLGAGGEPVARVEGSTTIELQHHDIQHSLFLATSLTGAVNAAFAYGPFGEVVTSIGDSSHRRQFNGKEKDAITGLRYYGARYYDAVSRRWTAGDPLFRFAPETNLLEPQRHNVYTFSGNNPVRYFDPDGLDGCEVSGPFTATCTATAPGTGTKGAITFGLTGIAVDAQALDVPLYRGGGDSVRSFIRAKVGAKVGATLRDGAAVEVNVGSLEGGFDSPVGGASGEIGLKLGLGLEWGDELKVTFGPASVALRAPEPQAPLAPELATMAMQPALAAVEAVGEIANEIANAVECTDGPCLGGPGTDTEAPVDEPCEGEGVCL